MLDEREKVVRCRQDSQTLDLKRGNSLASVTTVLVAVRGVLLLASLNVGDGLWLCNRDRKSQRQDGQEQRGRLHGACFLAVDCDRVGDLSVFS